MKWVLLSAALLASCPAQELSLEDMKEGLILKLDAYDTLKPSGDGKQTAFDLKLGESPVKIGKDVFDGFRFKCPELPEGTDFVWYFNAPVDWGNWYIVPVEGKPAQAVKNWLDGDKLYEPFDKSGEKGRLRILQTLTGKYFTPGTDYIMWFRKTGDAADNSLRGTLAFAKGKGEKPSWDHDEIEKALALKEAPAAAQVAALGSRGGQILLDKEFFEPGYAEDRIDSAFFSIRSTKRMSGGFFITTQIAVPPCKTTPSLAAIIKKHGEPDFTRTGAEVAKLSSHSKGSKPDDDEKDVTRHYYDYFALEVESTAKDPKVLRVVTGGTNFSTLHAPAAGSSYAQADLENLTVFHKDGKEVGRAYYFLEGDKEPLFIKEPPAGEYRSENYTLIAKGGGAWTWETRSPDGKPMRKLPLKDSRFHGKAEGFHENGQAEFTAEYRKGALDGEVVQFNEAGKEVSRRKFKDGKPEGEEGDEEGE